MGKDYQFEPNSVALVALRIYKEPRCFHRKILKDEWYLLNNWYRIEGDNLVRNDDERQSHRNLYGKNISVQAIVGKNGSGKSSLLELIYRIFNNLSYILTRGTYRPKAEKLGFVTGIHACLYFETDGKLGWLKCNNEYMHLFREDMEKVLPLEAYSKSDDYTKEKDKETREAVSKCFGYALVSNYALMSLPPCDFDVEPTNNGCNWINSIYAKNDGYQACIGIEPYKGYNIVDLKTQNSLNKTRLEGMIIATRDVGFYDGYKYRSISLKVDPKYTSRKANGRDKNEDEWETRYEDDFQSYYEDSKSIVNYILRYYGYTHLNLKDSTILSAAVYAVWKTLSTVETYNQFAKYRAIGCTEYFFKQAESTFTENVIVDNAPFPNAINLVSDMCDEMRNDTSHATLKIRQTLFFLDYVEQKCLENKLWTWNDIDSYEEYMNEVNGGIIPYSIDEINAKFPPPIFTPKIYLSRRKKTNKR